MVKCKLKAIHDFLFENHCNVNIVSYRLWDIFI